jgi:hypothetical protein
MNRHLPAKTREGERPRGSSASRKSFTDEQAQKSSIHIVLHIAALDMSAGAPKLT